MLSYATTSDIARVKTFAFDNLTPEEKLGITDYFRKATTYIDNTCRRRFFPYDRLREFSVPTYYLDLRNRSFIYADLTLDDDLLEVFTLQSGGVNTLIDTLDTLQANITATQNTIVVADAAGLDANGNTRFVEGTLFQIDNERFEVVLVSTNTLYVKRGALQTRRAAHTSTTKLYKLDVSSMTQGVNFHLLEFNIEPKFGIRLVFPATWTSSVVWRTRIPQIFVSGYFGYHNRYTESGWANTLTALKAALNATDTSFPLANAASAGLDSLGEPAYQVGYLLQIGRELMAITQIDLGAGAADDTIHVARGQNGSLPLPHAISDPIYRYNVPWDIREACLVCAKVFREADQATGGRQGVGEASIGVEIAVPKTAADILKLHLRASTYG